MEHKFEDTARKAENHPFESAGHSPGRNGTHGLTSNEHYACAGHPPRPLRAPTPLPRCPPPSAALGLNYSTLPKALTGKTP